MPDNPARFVFSLCLVALALMGARDAAAQSGRYPRCDTQPGFSNTTLTVVTTVKLGSNLKWRVPEEGPAYYAREILEQLNLNTRNITFREASGVTPNLFFNITFSGSVEGTTQATAYVEVTGLGKPGTLFTESSGSAPFNSGDAALDRLAANMLTWFQNGWSTRPPCMRSGRLVRAPGSPQQRNGSMFDLGLYGGGVWPTEWFDGAAFREAVEPGWTGGLMVQVGRPAGLRADLLYVSFGDLNENLGDATMSLSTNVTAGTLAAVLDLGGPYLFAGGGRYRFESVGTCEGNCGGVTDESVTEDYWGANGGIGLKLRIGGLSPFFEGRVHTVFPNEGDEEGNGTFVTGTFGIRFR